MNEFLILLILKLKPSNIYEIKKFIDKNFAPFLQVSLGALIPALKRLEKVNGVKKETSMTGGGLKRSVYSVLEKGEELFNLYLSEEIDSAPQLARREVEILLMLFDADFYGTEFKGVIFDDKQKKMLQKKIKNALEKNIALLENALKYEQINPEFLNMELIYSEAKLRYINQTIENEF